MAAKQKIIGRVAYANPSDNSQVYWKCPSRGCKQIHYFRYIPVASSGASPIYFKTCPECEKEYTAVHLTVSGTSIILAATFEEK